MGKQFVQLIESDCVAGLAAVPEGCVDVVVTSPPYNIGLQYKSYADNLAPEEYLEWSLRWLEAVMRVLKPEGSLFLNLGAPPSGHLMPHQVAIAFSRHLVLQNTFHWIKSITVETREGETISAGHFKPINSKRYVTDCHEYVFHFTKEGKTALDRLSIGVPYQDKSNINRWAHSGGADKRCRGNCWFIPYKTIRRRDSQRPHPATFPVQLAKNCILLHGVTDSTCVLDPFTGLGHSALAASECGAAEFIGFDIEEEYLQHARDQLLESAILGQSLEVALRREYSPQK